MALSLLDLTSNNNDLTNSGATESSTVPFSGANNTHSLDLEAGSSQYAGIADASQTGLDLTGDFTLEGWFKVESTPASDTTYRLIAKSVDDSNDRGYRLSYQNNAGTPRLLIQINESADDTTRDISSLTITLTPGIWYHIGVSCDISEASATTFVWYINGISKGNGTMVVSGNCASIRNSTAPFRIGVSSNATPIEFFDGLIDDVRVWSDVRTAQEISDNFAKELVGDEANLVGYWKLNNGYTDETSNNNDLTASGSPSFSTDMAFAGDNTASADLEATESDYLEIADASQTGLDLTGDFTLEAWVKFESLPSSNARYFILSKYLSSGNQRSYTFNLFNNAGTYKLDTLISADGTSAEAYEVTWTPTVGIWYHLTAVRDASEHSMLYYVNAVSQGSDLGDGANLTAQYNGTAPFQIGQINAGGYFDGLIDEVRVWSDIRTATEIGNNFTRELVGNEAGLVAYWSWDATESASPSLSPSASASPSSSPSLSPSPSSSESPSPSLSPSSSASPSSSESLSPSLSPSASDSPSSSVSLSPSLSPSASESRSPSLSPSPSSSVSLSPSLSPSLSGSPSSSASASVSLSPSSSQSPSSSVSPSPSASESLSPSLSPSLSESLSPSLSISLSVSLSPSLSPSVSESRSTSLSPSASESPSPSSSESPSPSRSVSASTSPSPSSSISPSPSSSVSPSPSPAEWYDKYSVQDTDWSDKYSEQGTSWTNKYRDWS